MCQSSEIVTFQSCNLNTILSYIENRVVVKQYLICKQINTIQYNLMYFKCESHRCYICTYLTNMFHQSMLASSEFQNIISDIGIHEFKLRFLNLSETEDKHYFFNKKILAVDQKFPLMLMGGRTQGSQHAKTRERGPPSA